MARPTSSSYVHRRVVVAVVCVIVRCLRLLSRLSMAILRGTPGGPTPSLERYWDPDVFVRCQCSPALASIYVIGGSGFRVLVWSPTA